MRTTPVRRLLQSVAGWGDCGLKHSACGTGHKVMTCLEQFRREKLHQSILPLTYLPARALLLACRFHASIGA